MKEPFQFEEITFWLWVRVHSPQYLKLTTNLVDVDLIEELRPLEKKEFFDRMTEIWALKGVQIIPT